MPKILFSPLVSEVRGRINGMVFSLNKTGNYVKRFQMPVDKNRSTQNLRRARFSYLINYWRYTLTPTQRTSWNTYAAGTPLLDAFGNDLYISGMNHFLRSNTLNLTRGIAIATTAPTTTGLGTPLIDTHTKWDVQASTNTIRFTLSNWTNWAPGGGNDTIFIYISPMYPESVTYFPGKKFYLNYVTSANVPAPVTTLSFILPFTAVDDLYLFVLFRYVYANSKTSVFSTYRRYIDLY